jgi:hypothetical protein
MNSDDFEKRLEQQSIREIPGEWRREILRTVEHASVPQLKTKSSKLKIFIAELLWPCPQAWAGLAAIWIVILALNFGSDEPKPKFAKSEPPSRDMILAMKEQRRLYLELVGTSSNEAAEPPKELAPRPQSKRETRFELV